MYKKRSLESSETSVPYRGRTVPKVISHLRIAHPLPFVVPDPSLMLVSDSKALPYCL